MGKEPATGKARHLLQRSWLLEEMGGAGHHCQSALAAHLRLRLTVEFEHNFVMAAYDEQRWRSHLMELRTRKIRTSSPGDDCGNRRIGLARCPQGRPGSGAGTEIANSQSLGLGLCLEPARGHPQAFRQELDVEDGRTVDLFVGGEQIKEQCTEPRDVQCFRHGAVAWTVTTASAAVGKDDQPGALLRNHEVSKEPHGLGLNDDIFITDRRIGAHRHLRTIHPTGGPLEKFHYFLVRCLGEVNIELADGVEGIRGRKEDQIVRNVPEQIDRSLRSNGRRQDYPRRAVGPCHLTGCPGRRPRCDAVVDHDRDPTGEGHAWMTLAKPHGSSIQFGSLPSLYGCHLVFTHSGHREYFIVQHAHAVLADRAHREFRLIGHPELSNEDGIERCVQHSGHLECNRHPTPRQPEHNGVCVPHALLQLFSQLSSRGNPVLKARHPDIVPFAGRAR